MGLRRGWVQMPVTFYSLGPKVFSLVFFLLAKG